MYLSRLLKYGWLSIRTVAGSVLFTKVVYCPDLLGTP